MTNAKGYHGGMRQYWWVLVYVGIRLVIALTFPVFNDEAIYAHWSQAVADYGPMGLTPMLLDGKQPGALIPWSLGQRLMGEWQPFLVLRLMSIGFGLITALMAFRLFFELTGKSVRGWHRLVYVLNPGLVWYESLGLQESLVMTCSMGLVLYAVWYEKGGLKKRSGIYWGGLLGLLVGLAWWIKPTALVALPALVYVLVRRMRLDLIVTAVLVAGVMVASLWLHPYAADFWRSSADRVGDSVSLLKFNKNLVWSLWWMGIISLWGVREIVRRRWWTVLMVVISGLVLPIFSGDGIYTSRYIAGIFPVLAMVGVVKSGWKVLGAQLLWSMIVVGSLAMNPLGLYRFSLRVPPVREDLSQYMESWTSGWGVREAIAYADSLATKNQKVIMVRRDAGNPESAVFAAFWRRKDVLVLTDAYWDQLHQQMALGAAADVLFISRDDHTGMVEKENIELLKQFDRPLESGHVGLWRLVVKQP